MSGRVVDLSGALAELPSVFIINTNLIFERLQIELLTELRPHVDIESGLSFQNAVRARDLFRAMRERELIGIFRQRRLLNFCMSRSGSF